ncbi:hypothetical protein MHYP_G00269440 [Metynnis hypsauchen]
MMTRFVDHRFTNMYRATIGVDFLTKEVTVDKDSVILQVSPERVQQWCENLGAEYFECSAKEDIDVDMAFRSAARAALQYFKCSVMDNRENIQIITNREPEERSNHSASKCTC